MSKNKDRKCRPQFNVNIDLNSSNEDGQQDLFKAMIAGDNDKDLDYQLPKKARIENASKLLHRNFDQKNKKLSPTDRIRRLNNKFSNKSTQNDSYKKKNAVIHDNNQSQTSLTVAPKFPVAMERFENLDDMFDTENSGHGCGNNDMVPKISNDPENFDHTVATNNTGYGTEVDTGRAKSETSVTAESLPLLDLILDLRNGINELTCNVNSLRKQVARMEMKTLGGPATNNSEVQMNIPPELFYDFDATLAAEGFPLSTCVQLNDFEIKLRNDPKYREKMVSIFCSIPLLILFSHFACTFKIEINFYR